MYLPIEFWLQIAQILSIPLTVMLVLWLLRPFLRQLFERVSRVDVGSFGIERLGVEPPGGSEGQAGQLQETHRQIAEGLAEGSKEKLEKLRLALETEQVNQLIQYHANSLAQSRISFWFSIAAATLGFVMVLSAVAMALMGGEKTTAAIGVLSGAIIDAVAALFFTQSNQARKLMTEFFDKLRLDRQFNESLRLCESIPDHAIQSGLKAKLALFFAGVPSTAVFGDDSMQGEHQRVQSRRRREPTPDKPLQPTSSRRDTDEGGHGSAAALG